MSTPGDQVPAKKLIAVSIAIIVLLFFAIVILMMRHQRLRRSTAVSKALPMLAEEDEKTLIHLRAFGLILEKHGWKVYWNEPSRYERHGTQHLQRGSLHHEFTDTEGDRVRLGIDALTFATDAELPAVEAFPLEKWHDLHPLRSFTQQDAFPFEVKRVGSTYVVFYKYQGKLPPKLPDQLETFIAGDSRQRATFRRELAEAHRREKEAREALRMIQQSLSKVDLYEGTPDGIHGWRTKHALQRFLRRQGYYSGDIDGVFGNRTLKALYEFRSEVGLEKNDALDLPLAKAMVKALASPPPTDQPSETPNT